MRLEPNGARFWATLEASAAVGRIEDTGLSRLALTRDDGAMRDLFVGWCRDGGYRVEIDPLGSIWAIRDGTDATLAPVAVGSHLDTQVKGGRFDGVLGVLAGLEVLRSLDDAGVRTRRAVAVVNWTNEEGARFQPPMSCSLAFAGKVTADWVLERRDRDGVRFGDALDAIGYRGDAPLSRTLDSYFELHIEQGPKLHAAGVRVGVVTGGFPTRAMRIEVEGETAHVGPTPMARRANALVGAAMVAVAVDAVGHAHAVHDGKATAARLDLAPNLPGIVSDRATLYVDFRHPSPDGLAAMEDAIEAACVDAATRSRTNIAIAERWGFEASAFDAGLIARLREAAAARGFPTLDLRSEAGHDAYHVASVAPVCMIFTPCDHGVSHNVKETTRLEDQTPGLAVLADMVLDRASRA
jgi:N-carbamoyl-L-amino-acid hydrolase